MSKAQIRKLQESYSILHIALQKIKRLNTHARKLTETEQTVRNITDDALDATRVWTTITPRI